MNKISNEPADYTWPSLNEIFEMIDGEPWVHISDENLEVIFWTMHPRFMFFKSLSKDANLLDIGANNGGLFYWKQWGSPHRTDINLYGVDLRVGELAHHYAGWDVLNLDEREPNFPGVKFNGFLATHLIEHLNDVDSLFSYMKKTAAPGASLYLEWPAPKTKNFPSVRELDARGFRMQTFNFYDDETHVDTLGEGEVAERLSRHGFQALSSGQIDLGAIARELLVRGRIADNMAWRQMGLWCATGWCNYVLAKYTGESAPDLLRA